MGLDLTLYTAWALSKTHRDEGFPYLARDKIVLHRESSFWFFRDDGEPETQGGAGMVRPLDAPLRVEAPGPNEARFDLTQDPYGNPLTYVEPFAFRGLKGESQHNEHAYRFVEHNVMTHGLIVVLWWC